MPAQVSSRCWRAAIGAVAAFIVLLAALPSVHSASITYEPDAEGRVKKATYDDGTIIDYEYDLNGNRRKATVILSADTTPPSAPSGLTATLFSQTQTNLSWAASSDNRGVAGYEVQRCTGANCTSFTQIATPASTSYSDTGLSPSTTYVYRVRALDAAGNASEFSTTASATTPDTGTPTAPGTPSFSNITMTSATASWTAATDSVGVTGYEYRLNSGSWQTLGNVLSVNLTGLSPYTSYAFEVRARDAAANVGPASSSIFSTPDTAPPGVPGTPSFSSITMSSATASWTAATENVGVTGYEYRLNSGNWQSLGNVLSVSLTGLSANTAYTFQVRAKDAANNVGAASSGAFTTPDTQAPNAPGTPSFSSITMTSATASWTAASDNDAVNSYEYQLNGGAWNAIGNVLSAGLTGLSPATSYTFAVRARDRAGNAGASSSNSFTTPDTASPSAPGAPSFSSITSSSATAAWSSANDNVGVTGYEYRLNGGAWQSLGNVLSVSLSGLSAATSYMFEVRARDAAGNLGAIGSGSFSTLANIIISNYGFSTQGSGGSIATYALTSGGDTLASQTRSTQTTDVGDWLAPKVGMSGYQALATLTSTSPPCSSGPIGTWVSLGSGASWTKSWYGPFGSGQACVVILQIRHSSNPSVILGSAQITIAAVNAP